MATEYDYGNKNLMALQEAQDAKGRTFTISKLDPEPIANASVVYANFYLANGSVIVPIEGNSGDEPALSFLGGLYPGREIVGVPGQMLAFGGGGPHCITQQIPSAGPTSTFQRS